MPTLEDALSDADRKSFERAYEYMGLSPARPWNTSTSTQSFSAPARTAASKTSVPPRPLSRATASPQDACDGRPRITGVKRQAEAEGLDAVFKTAGFDWREPGCSMCLGMNPDILAPGERCASTSNRNFEGRQGRGGRTHLLSRRWPPQPPSPATSPTSANGIATEAPPTSTIDTPHIVDSPEMQLALIHLTVPRSEIMHAMPPAYAELEAVLRAQGIPPTGPWFAHHLHRPSEIFEFNLCSPVAKPVEPTGRVTNGTLRATKVVRTIHHGPYEGLGAAWGEFVAWIAPPITTTPPRTCGRSTSPAPSTTPIQPHGRPNSTHHCSLPHRRAEGACYHSLGRSPG